MSLNTRKMIIGALLSGLFMNNASKVLSKDIVTVLPEVGQFFFEELRDIPNMRNPLMSADGYWPCKTNPAESEFAQQIGAMGWAILFPTIMNGRSKEASCMAFVTLVKLSRW